MDGLVISWREVLLVAIAVLAVYVLELVLLLRRRDRSRQRPQASPAAPDPRLRELGQQLQRLSQDVARINGELEQLKGAQQAGSPYRQAIALAEQGLSAREVASGCGISRGEAELIVALYRKPAR